MIARHQDFPCAGIDLQRAGGMVRPGKHHYQRLCTEFGKLLGGQLSMTNVEVGPTSLPTDQPPQTEL